MLHQPSSDENDELQLSDEMEVGAGDEPPKGTPGSGRASRAAAQRAKPPERPRVTKPAKKSPNKNPYRTRTAAQIRAEREARGKRSITSLTDEPRAPRRDNVLEQAKVAELLRNPTRVVTEDELRHDYTYVVKDLRGMGLLAAGLVVVLISLAYLLPR